MVEVTAKELALIKMLRTEITAGMVLQVKTCQEVAWNDSRKGVLCILDSYAHGTGLLQQPQKETE